MGIDITSEISTCPRGVSLDANPLDALFARERTVLRYQVDEAERMNE